MTFILKTSSFPLVSLLIASACASQSVWAQAQSDAAAAQRGLAELPSNTPAATSKLLTEAQADLEGSEDMDRLDSVDIVGDRLQAEIQAYWKQSLGHAVSQDQMSRFKVWFSELAKANGYLAYVATRSNDGRLVVTQVVPRLNNVRVFATDQALAKQYIQFIHARLESQFQPGSLVDLLALEQQLDALSLARPLALDVVIRSAGPGLLDLNVNVTELPSRLGHVMGGVVQLNNHGLKQYGPTQLLGQVTLGGLAPSSRITLTGQKSEGIDYVRAEQDSPIETLDARLQLGLGGTRSEGIFNTLTRTVSHTRDAFVSLETTLGHRGTAVFKGATQLSYRRTRSNLSASGVELNRVHDQQARLQWSADSGRWSNEPMRVEITGAIGYYSQLTGIAAVPDGRYAKLEFSARKQFNLTDDAKYFGLIKVRGQRTSHHVDSYNQISLGGTTGVRAYTTADGVGDDGAVAALELSVRTDPGHSVGVFYDAGRVRASKAPVNDGRYSRTYSLQAWGVQLNGKERNVYYNASLAKGVHGNKGALPSDFESSPNNWRLSVSGTYLF